MQSVRIFFNHKKRSYPTSCHPQWREAISHCKEYGSSFKLAGTLKRHIRIHTGEKSYQCTKCDYASTESCGLIKHMRKNYKDVVNSKEVKSKEFSKSFGRVDHLKTHLHIHTAQCVLCSVYFSAQPNKLRPILELEFWYPIEHIFVPVSKSVRKIHLFTFFVIFKL